MGECLRSMEEKNWLSSLNDSGSTTSEQSVLEKPKEKSKFTNYGWWSKKGTFHSWDSQGRNSPRKDRKSLQIAKKKSNKNLNLPEKTRDILVSLEHLTSPIDTKLKTSSSILNRSGKINRNLPPVGWRQHTPKKISEKAFGTKSLNVTLAEEKEI